MSDTQSFHDQITAYGPQAVYDPPSLDQARDYCRRFTRRHYENFRVASWLLPKQVRPAFHAIYAYCRWADDLADEVTDSNRSLELLDWWRRQLTDCFGGEARHPVFVALKQSIEEYSIPEEPFANLLLAFQQDQQQTEYGTAADLVDYCRYSANPVGRLVLYVANSVPREFSEAPLDPNAERAIAPDDVVQLSDSICTGLQWANHCQDIKRDFDRGRVYLPLKTFEEFGYDVRDLALPKFDDPFRRLMKLEVNRAERFLQAGWPLLKQVPAWLRPDLALFIDGGLEIIAAIRRQNHDVLHQRPRVSKWVQMQLLIRAWGRERKAMRGPA